MSVNGGPNIIENGLIFSVDAADKTSYPGTGTAWNDLVGSSNGVLTNGPTFSTEGKGSIVFDGTNDYAEVTQRNTDLEFQPNQPYTCLVFYKSPPSGLNGGLISNMISSGSYSGWDISFNNSSPTNAISMHLISFWNTNAIKIIVDYDFSFYANKWLYFGYTYDGSCPTNSESSLNSVNFYLNGRLYSSGKSVNQGGDGFNSSSEVITYNTSQRFRVAGRWASGAASSPSPVSVGSVLVYNRVLSASEILQNYNATKSRFGL